MEGLIGSVIFEITERADNAAWKKATRNRLESGIGPLVIVNEDGFIKIPQVPGAGYGPKEDYIDKVTLRKETFSI